MNVSNTTRILITAGATNESIDDVRYLGNRSSGQLGALLGFTAAVDSYEVTLLLGSNCIHPASHPRLKTIPFSSARDLAAKISELWQSHDLLIMAAAVADFTPKGGQTDGKIPRGKSMTLELCPTEDIVARLASSKREDQRVICFALEEEEKLHAAALEKMNRKKVDAIVANPLETMESKTITAQVFCKDGRHITAPEDLPKSHFAEWFIEHLSEILSTT